MSPEEGLTGRKIIYDEDGKPCRSCNTLLDFKFATGKISKAGSVIPAMAATDNSAEQLIPGSKTYKKIDPPDVQQLGASSWSLLHSIAAKYPKTPSETQQKEMSQFLNIFSHIYPCNWCAADFEKYIRENAPKVSSREELGRWMCDAHNKVNVKLGKPKFNCDFWEKRWKDGWDE